MCGGHAEQCATECCRDRSRGGWLPGRLGGKWLFGKQRLPHPSRRGGRREVGHLHQLQRELHARAVLGRRHLFGEQVRPGDQRPPPRHRHLEPELRRGRARTVVADQQQVRQVRQRDDHGRSHFAADPGYRGDVHRLRVLRRNARVSLLEQAAGWHVGRGAELLDHQHADVGHDGQAARHVHARGGRAQPGLDSVVRHGAADAHAARAVRDPDADARPSVAAAARDRRDVDGFCDVQRDAGVSLLDPRARRRVDDRPELRHIADVRLEHRRTPLRRLRPRGRREDAGHDRLLRKRDAHAVLTHVVHRYVAGHRQDLTAAHRHDGDPDRGRDLRRDEPVPVLGAHAGRGVDGRPRLQPDGDLRVDAGRTRW